MRFTLTWICSGLVLLGLILGTILFEGFHTGIAFQPAALLIIIGGTLGYCIIAFPKSAFLSSIKIAIRPKDAEFKEALIATEIFQAAGNAAIMLGIIGQISGLIAVMENLSNPNAIGPGVAASFVPILYAYLFRILFSNPLTSRTRQISVALSPVKIDVPDSAEVVQLKAKIADLVIELDERKKGA